MRELEETAQAAQATCLISAIRQMYEDIARLSLDACPSPKGWTVPLLIQQLIDEGFLAGALPVTQQSVSTI
jgi:hypothetical protein